MREFSSVLSLENRMKWYENLTGLGKQTKALQEMFVRAELGKQKGMV